MSFPYKYVPRSLQNVFDRIAAKNDREIQSAVSTDLPKTFEVVIYDSMSPNTKSKISEKSPPENPESIDSYYYYRARSRAGHHDLLLRPEAATTFDQYERFRSEHFQAIIPKNTSDLPTTGDVYVATMMGEKLVSLDSKVRDGTIPELTRLVEEEDDPKKDGAKESFNSTTEPEQTVDDLVFQPSTVESLGDAPAEETPSPPTVGPEIKFKYGPNSQAGKDYNDSSKPYYKSFIDKLVVKLGKLGFSASSITINSTTRDAAGQIDAMMGAANATKGRYNKGQEFFTSWVITTYSNRIESAFLPVIQQYYSDGHAKLREEMIKKANSLRPAMSKHMESGALDINSNKVSFDDCEIMEVAIAELISENVATYGTWEGVADLNPKSGPTGKERRKALIGANPIYYDVNEHFHIALVLTTPGE